MENEKRLSYYFNQKITFDRRVVHKCARSDMEPRNIGSFNDHNGFVGLPQNITYASEMLYIYTQRSQPKLLDA